MIKFDIKGLQDLEDTINGLLHHGGYRRLRKDVEYAELNKNSKRRGGRDSWKGRQRKE